MKRREFITLLGRRGGHLAAARTIAADGSTRQSLADWRAVRFDSTN